jgi:hypothetical protein
VEDGHGEERDLLKPRQKRFANAMNILNACNANNTLLLA